MSQYCLLYCCPRRNGTTSCPCWGILASTGPRRGPVAVLDFYARGAGGGGGDLGGPNRAVVSVLSTLQQASAIECATACSTSTERMTVPTSISSSTSISSISDTAVSSTRVMASATGPGTTSIGIGAGSTSST